VDRLQFMATRRCGGLRHRDPVPRGGGGQPHPPMRQERGVATAAGGGKEWLGSLGQQRGWPSLSTARRRLRSRRRDDERPWCSRRPRGKRLAPASRGPTCRAAAGQFDCGSSSAWVPRTGWCRWRRPGNGPARWTTGPRPAKTRAAQRPTDALRAAGDSGPAFAANAGSRRSRRAQAFAPRRGHTRSLRTRRRSGWRSSGRTPAGRQTREQGTPCT